MSDSPLHPRWNALCLRVGAFKNAQETELTFDMVKTLYTHPPRAYHNLAHIEQVLAEFDQVFRLANDRDAVEMALWLHDCVYIAARPDNEERSADAAAMITGLLGCPPEFLAKVRDGIMATRHSTDPGKGDPALIADIDLTIVGSSREQYDTYRRQIRAEFAFADDEPFRVGRLAFVQRMIDKERIFTTPHYFKALEDRARDNLYREMDELERQK
ncbi:MAG: hypothetical protein K2W85_12645 [Phycisphaerales bacterium]|nr:hypothetical protein [Phycisphaerales bacterium]